MSDDDLYAGIRNGDIYREYGISADEAAAHEQINDIYSIKFKRLQTQLGTRYVPFAASMKISDEARRAHAAIAAQRHEEQAKEKARADREAARKAKEAAAGSTSPAHQPSTSPAQPSPTSEPQRPAGGLAGAGAGAVTSGAPQRATLAPAQHSAGTVADVETALAAFTGQPDREEQQ